MHVVLSDIDESLILREQVGDKVFHGINKAVFDMLKHETVSHLALMSDVDLSDIDNELRIASTSISERKHINYVSKQQLITHLQQLHSTLSITTQADLIYRAGINIEQGAYHAFYMEAYHTSKMSGAHYEQLKCSAATNNPFIQNNHCVNRINTLPGYNIELEKNKKLADALNERTITKKRYDANAATQKHFMFKYIMECLPKSMTMLTYIEDDVLCIQAITAVCANYFPNIRLNIVHIHEPGTPYPSLQHPNATYCHLERPNIPLYILGTKNYENVVDFINARIIEEDKPALYQADLSFEKMAELTMKEALYIEILLECLPHPTFTDHFNQTLLDAGTNLETIKINSKIDPANERKTLISALVNMSQENKALLSEKVIATAKGFRYASTDRVVFCYYPKLLTQHLPQNSKALYSVICNLVCRLEPYKNNNLEDIRKSINNCNSTFWHSNENKMLEQYPKIILNILEQLVAHRYNEHAKLNNFHRLR